tara:strand:+ start:699 stop:1034 length:336 start_codon:yes stop_codon:yes gene_type:complete
MDEENIDEISNDSINPGIYVIWNSKTKRILMCTFNESLANQVTEHFVEGLERSKVSVYQDIEEYLEEGADEIAEEARKKLTPLEYEAIKRTIEEEYPQYSEFDHEARMIYD